MKSRWFAVLILMVSSAALAEYQTDSADQLLIGVKSKVPKSKKPPKNPVTSTQDKQKKKLWLNKTEKFYPLKGSPKSTATPMNKLPKPGTILKPGKRSLHPSLYADPSK